nr:ATP-binding cassette domain-containing protein [Marinicella sp. W31]MDC2878903.1 ATP-binding cassette domain-containing protein [Marinicella sp. W31]
MTLLSFNDVDLSFSRYDGLLTAREIPILKRISFSLKCGEVVALIGASGGGKSLIAHALFGILPPNALIRGDIRFDGQRVDDGSRPSLLGRRMALVPQSISHLDPLARCFQQLRWAARRAGLRVNDAALVAMLTHFGLDARAAQAFPHQLSGGMARRMLMAIATVGNPDLIVADEPTSGLDDDNAAIVLSKLKSMADAGKGVLLITHSLATALAYADSVCLVRQGRVEGVERAEAFEGCGQGLSSDYARALWHALPQNGFRVTGDA